MEHYTYMVNLIGYIGCLNEEKYFINSMSVKLKVTISTYLLGAHRIHTKELCIIWQNAIKRDTISCTIMINYSHIRILNKDKNIFSEM